MSRSQGLERFLGCLNGWTCESALPLDLERDAWYVHHRVAVQLTLPLGPERTDCTAIWHRSYRFGTLTPVWQSRPHCHSALSVPRPHPFTATRHRTYRSHCHSTLNATCGTFTVDWQCELHCHSAPSVLDHLAIISMSILRAGSRPCLYRSLGIKRQVNRTVGPCDHVRMYQRGRLYSSREDGSSNIGGRDEPTGRYVCAF